MRHWKLFPGRVMLSAFAVCVIAIGFLPGHAAAANLPITFEFTLRSPGECIYVPTAANTPTNVTLRSAAGQIKAQGTLAAEDAFFCLDSSTWVDSGDTLRASDGSYTRRLVVPKLSIEVDRVNDTYLGTGPAGRTLLIEYPGTLFGDVGLSSGVRVGQDGNWSFDPHHDLIWSMDGSISWESPKGDRLHAYGSAPFITLTIGKSGFSGWTTALGTVEASLQDGQMGSASTVADLRGEFSGQFRDTQGHRVKVSSGDRLTAPGLAADADWIVPSIEAAANAVTDVVTGVCEQTGSLSDLGNVQVVRTGHVRGRAYVALDENGQFSIDFGGNAHPGFTPVNIKSGDKIVVGCMIATGDWAQRVFRTP